MATSKDYRDYILEQLSLLNNITCRPMMGEFLLYADGCLFGGIYDNRLLIKIVDTNKRFKLKEVIPYPGAKAMLMVDDLDDKEYLSSVIEETVKGLRKQSS